MLEKKLNKNHEYAKLYRREINRLIEPKFAEKNAEIKSESRTWYLPHFGVYSINKPNKVRLVFDAAAKTMNTCLDDQLLV